MKKLRYYLTILGLFVVLFSSPEVLAQSVFSPENVPNVRLKDKRQYVSDPTDILSSAEKHKINEMLFALEQKTGAEVAIVTLPSIGEIDCFEFGLELFNKWGIGKSKKDNGLLILLVTDQRCVQFNTGYGLEGILPDIICKQIQRNDMIPYLKEGNWSMGMLAGVNAVYKILYDNMEDGVVLNEPYKNDSFLIILIILGLSFTFVIIIPLAVIYHRSKCPKCKKHKLQRMNSKVIQDTPRYRVIENEFKCRNCGNIVKRTVKQYKSNNNNRGGGGGGPVIFGPSRGGGGGSFGGGSFGGGRSGGGGAGSRF